MINPTPDGAAAFKIVSGMEARLTIISELAYAIQMASENATDLPAEPSGALWRLAHIIQQTVADVEDERAQAFEMLHAYAYPPSKAVAS